MDKKFTKSFLILLVLSVLVVAYLIFRPFLTEIFMAAILVTVFYIPFERLSKFLKGRRNLAAILMCLILVLVIIIPGIKLISVAGQKSVGLYNSTVEFFENHSINEVFEAEIFKSGPLSNINFNSLLESGNETFKDLIIETSKKVSNIFVDGATVAVKETTKFIVSLALVIFTMFFFFVDGKKILRRLMYLSPLPNKYDKEIFAKFRKVSYTIFVSTFVAALVQGAVGAIGFAIVGFPALLAGILIALLSLLPYIGSMIFYVPVAIFYLLTGDIWQGLFILAWGFLIIGTVDNLVRAFMIKGDAGVNPIFVLFSILGGLSLFGFWGIILGPLIIALMVTVFHIYELEFCDSLDDMDYNKENKDDLSEGVNIISAEKIKDKIEDLKDNFKDEKNKQSKNDNKKNKK
jgi:predicted PurR-regulated permease PerM